ncbi:hypothetical protein LPJ56_002533 [Coemansia sp. RSA 2599]|nr:hypothetical protein LPJ75_001706 [Coemansia sp. RSA 2598]KAJ1825735.1 hypothetical protein LPJ56_002533 [Coemansia sp. RSA 2599]
MKLLTALSVLFVSATCLYTPNFVDGTLEPAFKVKPDINRIVAGFAQSPGAKENSNHKRTSGGAEMAGAEAPYIVSLSALGADGPQLCGGILIADSAVATPAHCIHDSNGDPIPAQNITIGYGSAKESEQLKVTALAAISHPNFVMPKTASSDVNSDIAIIWIPKLKTDAMASRTSVDNNNIKTGKKTRGPAWGIFINYKKN